jgi:hypothetical protein
MWLSVVLSTISEAIWAQIRKLFNGPQFERNIREALCCWSCGCDRAFEGGRDDQVGRMSDGGSERLSLNQAFFGQRY